MHIFSLKLCKIVLLSSFLVICSASVSQGLLFQAVISPELLNYFDMLGYEKSCPNLNIIYKPIFSVLSGSPRESQFIGVTIVLSQILETAINTLSKTGGWWKGMRSHTCVTSLQPSHVCVGTYVCACTHTCVCLESRKSVSSSVGLCLIFETDFITEPNAYRFYWLSVLAVCTGCLANHLQGFSHVNIPVAGTIDACHHIQLLLGCWGFKVGSSCSYGRCFTH